MPRTLRRRKRSPTGWAAVRSSRAVVVAATAAADNQPGNCDSYRDDLAAVGLPVDTFANIMYRESRCNPGSTVVDWNDTGGGLFGFNFKGNLAGYWANLCGLTFENMTSSVDLQMRCAKAAYDQLGLQPWEGSA